jgi:hypothetical protein
MLVFFCIISFIPVSGSDCHKIVLYDLQCRFGLSDAQDTKKISPKFAWEQYAQDACPSYRTL